MSTSTTIPTEFKSQLEQAGFSPAGTGTFRNEQFELRLEEGWGVLSALHARIDLEPLSTSSDVPGLWKPVGTNSKHVIDLPPAVLSPARAFDTDIDPTSTLLQSLRWAMASFAGQPPADWEPPVPEEVRSWLAPGQLTVQHGRHARQMTLRHEDHRLALNAPLVPAIPDGLSEQRLAWLRGILIDTQSRWRMVRVRFTEDHAASTVVAEVDFSGAPHLILEPLFAAGLEALRCAIQWSVQSADLLTDASVDCRAWEVRRSLHILDSLREKGVYQHV